MYKNYIFDLYGTLADINTDEEDIKVWEKLSLFYSYHGALYSPEELKKSYEELVKKKETAGYGYEAYPEIQIEKVFHKLYDIKDIDADETLVLHTGQFFRILTTEYICLYDGVKEILEELKNSGRKIYLLSNAQRIFTEYELNMLDVIKYFDGIMISSDYGVKKPDRRFFELLLNKYNLHAAESIMIGNDLMTDIYGGNMAGIDTCYIHSNISPDYSPDKKNCLTKPTYILEEMNIKELHKILK